jgi:hypothetical protein
MTKQTDTKVLRQTIDGILSAYEIDNLELSIKLCEAFKKMDDSKDIRATRDEILAGLQRGASKVDELKDISEEIFKATRLRPVTPAWVEFVEFAWKEAKKGKTITAFLSWWNSDEWQATHPPAKPDTWYVKWDMAFVVEVKPENIQQPTASGGFR